MMDGRRRLGARPPVRVAVANDYDLVVAGLAALLAPYRDRVEVADAIVAGQPVDGPVHVALYDTFGREALTQDALTALRSTPGVERVAVYTLCNDERVHEAAREGGAVAVISKRLTAPQLVVAVERAAQAAGGPLPPLHRSVRRMWPGRELGLTERESETVVLAAQGLTNKQISAALYVSVDTVKSHLQRAFRKLGTTNRAQLAGLVLREPAFRLHVPAATARAID